MTSAASDPHTQPSSAPSATQDRPLTVNDLPDETLQFASKSALSVMKLYKRYVAADMDGVFDLARSGDTEQLEAYLEAGLPVNLTNHTGATLLMLAAYHGHASTVSALIKRGADVNALNDKGQSPLAGAVFKGEEAVVKLLAEAGADPNAGQPSAVQAATVFNKPQYLELFNRPTGDQGVAAAHAGAQEPAQTRQASTSES